jgi:hypothetical protein
MKARNLVVIPMTLAVFLTGIIWIAGLILSRCRRDYILQASSQMTEVIRVIAQVEVQKLGK